MAIEKEVLLPDIGDFKDVEVTEVLVAVGDHVEVDESLIVLESDKATMEIPSPLAGLVREIRVAPGDRVSRGALIAIVEVGEATAKQAVSPAPQAAPPPPAAPLGPTPQRNDRVPPRPPRDTSAGQAHASPSVRRLARELGVDLQLVAASGRKGRILKQDVQGYVQGMLAKGTSAGVPIAGIRVAAPREIDFSRYGRTELQAVEKLRRRSAANLHRSWVTIPHVTQFDEADITELDAFRKAQQTASEGRGIKLTFLPFVVKACTAALQEFPHFNSSLDHTGENLILKHYFHIGVAVDTASGLVVPVIRDADQKGLFQLAQELQELSARARERKLRFEDLEGGSFSISSLGGIGGTFFTPIVNHPEVAVLGVSRMQWKPIYRGEELVARLVLPLSLSYDHRVIDGADAVRFTRRLAEFLSDLRLLLL